MPRYFSANHIVERQVLALAVAPVLAHLRVQVLGGRLGQPIGQRLDHDRVVVVLIALELPGQRVGADAGRDGEHAEVVGDAALARRDEVGERQIRPLVGDDLLLPQHREPRQLASPRVVGEDDDVVAVGRSRARTRRRPVAVSSFSSMIRSSSVLRVLVQLARGRAVLRMLEDRPGTGPSAPRPRRRTSSR